VTLSTDVIVGFPGETREDFEATLALVDTVGFAGLFGFKYSQRPNTPALRFADDVSEEEKSQRLEELFELADGQRRAHLQSRVGQIEDVLVEGRGRGDEYSGRSERNEIVHVESGDRDPSGRLVKVRIERAYKNSLFGTLVDTSGLPPRARATGALKLPLLNS
jgi:tRNA-2-methylthio-N6-dimethylallyladenosine synthase